MERNEAKGAPRGHDGGTPARTLEELGVPRLLARELEGALAALAERDGARAVTFVTPDGETHAVRVP